MAGVPKLQILSARIENLMSEGCDASGRQPQPAQVLNTEVEAGRSPSLARASVFGPCTTRVSAISFARARNARGHALHRRTAHRRLVVEWRPVLLCHLAPSRSHNTAAGGRSTESHALPCGRNQTNLRNFPFSFHVKIEIKLRVCLYLIFIVKILVLNSERRI